MLRESRERLFAEILLDWSIAQRSGDSKARRNSSRVQKEIFSGIG
jgi:hypothetical protein